MGLPAAFQRQEACGEGAEGHISVLDVEAASMPFAGRSQSACGVSKLHAERVSRPQTKVCYSGQQDSAPQCYQVDNACSLD